MAHNFLLTGSKEYFYFNFSKTKLFFISHLGVTIPPTISMADVISLENESLFILQLTFYIKLQGLCVRLDCFFISPESYIFINLPCVPDLHIAVIYDRLRLLYIFRDS